MFKILSQKLLYSGDVTNLFGERGAPDKILNSGYDLSSDALALDLYTNSMVSASMSEGKTSMSEGKIFYIGKKYFSFRRGKIFFEIKNFSIQTCFKNA